MKHTKIKQRKRTYYRSTYCHLCMYSYNHSRHHLSNRIPACPTCSLTEIQSASARALINFAGPKYIPVLIKESPHTELKQASPFNIRLSESDNLKYTTLYYIYSDINHLTESLFSRDYKSSRTLLTQIIKRLTVVDNLS